MSKNKNKQKDKPAVGSPAAGSNNKREKSKFTDILKSKKVIIPLVIAVVAVAVLCVFLFGNVSVPSEVRNAEYKGRLEPESVAVKTSLSLSRQEKLSAGVNATGDVAAFDFYVNDKISISHHNDPVLLEFGSVETNDCVLLAFLVDENGEIIYRSLGVEPGEEIRSVSLYDSVEYGSREATLVVNGYDKNSYKKTGTQSVKIQMEIGADNVEK